MLPELSVIKYLLMIAAVRTLFAAVALIGEKQYRVLLKNAEHETGTETVSYDNGARMKFT